MNFEDIKGFIVVPLTLFATAFFIIKPYFNALKHRKEALKEMDEAYEVKLKSETATVISKESRIIYNKNIKIPEHNVVFYVTFRVGEISKRLEVSEKVFQKIDENQEGTLLTQNGNFYDFK